MPKSRWLFILALGGLAHAQDAPVVLYNDAVLVCSETGCWQRSSEENGNQPSDGAGTQESTANESDNTEPASQTTITYSPSSNAPPPSEEKRAKADLKAQQDMAFWAMLMFLATLAGVILIGWTLGEAKKTSKLARNTLLSTRTATRAAIKTTRVTKNIGEAQIIAYLSATSAEYSIDVERREIDIKLRLKNVGQTPARGIGVSARLKFFTAFGDMPETTLPAKFTDGCRALPVGGDYEFRFWLEDITLETLQSVERGDTNIFLYADANFVDVLKHRQDEDFTFIHQASDADWARGTFKPT